MEKMSGLSINTEQINIDKIKEMFPNVVTEGKIDFDMLRTLLGDAIDTSKEKYQFVWNGKAESIKLAQTPSASTLRPSKEKSKNWNETENIYIEGDNLEALKLLQKTYYGRVKMIYIDPPYNTGNDFVYKDDFSNSIENYKQQTQQVQNSNPETSGRFHSNWLNLIYPRLILARNLLADDGVIFISIDINESENMKRICDEIFGESNFRNQLLVRRRIKSLNVQFADNGLKSFNVGFEYIYVYSKSQRFLFNPIRMKKNDVPAKGSWNVFWSNADRPTMRYEILGFTPTTGQWRWQKEMAYEAVKNYETYEKEYSEKMTLEEYYKKTGETLRFIRRIKDGTGKNGGVQYWVAPSDTSLRTSNWTDIEVSQIAKDYDLPFDNPKNVELIKTVISSVPGNDFIVLDFFAGSSTTADAVFRINNEDGGKRKLILVQLPDLCAPDSDAAKAGYNNICEIGEERIRLAGNRITDENPLGTQALDVGFKVFKLDSTNINPWDNTTEYDENTIYNSASIFKLDRTKEDILYEIMLKYGVFDQPVSEVESNGKKLYRVGQRHMIVCLEDNIDSTDISEICKQNPRVVVFKEDGFKDDNAKINAEYNLKNAGVEDVKCI